MPNLIPEVKRLPLEQPAPDDIACQCHADVAECQCEDDRPVLLRAPRRIELPPPAAAEPKPTCSVSGLSAGLLLVLLGIGAMFVAVSAMPVVLIFLAFFLPALLPLILVAVTIVATEGLPMTPTHDRR